MLPPLTLLAVKEVLDEFEYLPGQPPIQQKCIVMRPTFMMSPSLASADSAAGKFAPPTTFLTCTPRRASSLRQRPCCAQHRPRSPPTPFFFSFARSLTDGKTDAYVTSLVPIIDQPSLKMQKEWERGDTWIDRDGNECSAADEWKYVVSRVGETPGGGTGFGRRDEGNENMTPEDFLRRANDFVREQAKEMGREVDAEHDLLSLEELIAIRLFTGPGFYVINEFLRQLAELAPPYRKRIASQRGVTYSDTCRNLVNGIRKLARFTSVPTQARHTRHPISAPPLPLVVCWTLALLGSAAGAGSPCTARCAASCATAPTRCSTAPTACTSPSSPASCRRPTRRRCASSTWTRAGPTCCGS